MPKGNGQWWNGGWQRRAKSEWDGETASNFREDDVGCVTPSEPAKGSWVDGLPDDPKKIARPLIKEGKYLAIEQLKVAKKFLCDTKNDDVTSVLANLFFGESDIGYFREKWQIGIDKVLAGLVNLDTKRHVNYFSKKSKSTTAAEMNVTSFEDKSGTYLNAYANKLIEIYESPYLGKDHLAHVLIHEMSHACLKTNDYCYIGVLSHVGFHDLTKMVELLSPTASDGESERMCLARGRREAWNNADSFTTSVRYLAYSAKQQAFFDCVKEKIDEFKRNQSSQLLIKSTSW